MHEMRAGTNGFTCMIIVPDPLGGPVCGDAAATAWFNAMLTRQSGPPASGAPGIAYMARGGFHYEDAKGAIHMAHSPAAGTRRVTEPPHWMMMYAFDPAATGLPVKARPAGSYIMFAGTPWAHLMIYQNPNRLSAR